MSVCLSTRPSGIRAGLIPAGVCEIVKTLKTKGYLAWVIGGAVRDLIVFGGDTRRPNDFDIATTATPNEVKRVFGDRARVIRAKYQIVHVRSQGDEYDVCTLRNSDGSFGTDLSEDYSTRDFTINAMYLDLPSNQLTSTPQAFDDIKHKRLKSIGDPNQSIQSKPAFLLRAIRFAATLNLTIDPLITTVIIQNRHLLNKLDQVVRSNEIIKLLKFGNPQSTYQILSNHSLLDTLLPQYPAAFSPTKVEMWFQAFLKYNCHSTQTTDGDPTAFLLAALFWPILQMQPSRLYCANCIAADSDWLKELAKPLGLTRAQRTAIVAVYRNSRQPSPVPTNRLTQIDFPLSSHCPTPIKHPQQSTTNCCAADSNTSTRTSSPRVRTHYPTLQESYSATQQPNKMTDTARQWSAILGRGSAAPSLDGDATPVVRQPGSGLSGAVSRRRRDASRR